MPAHDLLVRRFTRRLAGWCVLRQAVAAVTACAFLWGTAVLVLRATLGTPADHLLWGAAALPVAVGLAAWVALRRLPAPAAVRALLDREAGCGGLLMAGAERDLGRWARRVTVGELPRLRWRAGRPLGLLAVAAGYVVLGFLLPAARPANAGDSPLDVNRATDRLAEQVRVLKEEKVIEPKRAETLAQKLDEVRDRAAAKDPAKTLEALDHLADVVRQAARQAAESGARKADQLGRVEAGAEALKEAAPALDPKAAAALMADLAAMARQAAAEGEQLDGAPDADLAEAVKSGTLSGEHLAKLAAAAKAGKGKVGKSARKLYDAKLIDADQLKACEGEGACDGKGLAEFLKKNGGKAGLGEAMSRCPGRGGVTDDGPSETALEFGDRSSEAGAKFREEALPPAQRAALQQSQTSGVSTTAPQRDPKAGPPTAGGLGGAAAGGGSANAAPVLPQHRATVERYFDRPGK